MRAHLPEQNYPTNYPNYMSGTFTKKVIIKDDTIRKDKTAPIYIQVFVNKQRKRYPLGVSVEPKHFDKKKQRVKGSASGFKNLNLIIENELSKFTAVSVNYKLRNEYLTIEKLTKELNDGFSRQNFIKYYENELKKQLETHKIVKSTHKQQKSTLKKLTDYKSEILFHEITTDLIDGFKTHLKIKLGNSENTIFTALKNVKKYLHLAYEDGIETPLPYYKISVRSIKGNRDFLEDYELQNLFKFYKSEFINATYRKVIKKFLFSCFTGLRISDVQTLTQQNFIGEYLVFTSVKGNKLNKIPLNKTAKLFINTEGPIFDDDFTDQAINENLKFIAKACSIKKKITFHVARHTFATQYLINGGKVEELKVLLGHEKIETTMIYVHIVKKHLNIKIHNLDAILSL